MVKNNEIDKALIICSMENMLENRMQDELIGPIPSLVWTLEWFFYDLVSDNNIFRFLGIFSQASLNVRLLLQ